MSVKDEMEEDEGVNSGLEGDDWVLMHVQSPSKME